jgi:hypothetical protein
VRRSEWLQLDRPPLTEVGVTVRLLMQVSRGNDGRLGGQVLLAGSNASYDFSGTSNASYDFSGTLELLNVLESLVLPDGDDGLP